MKNFKDLKKNLHEVSLRQFDANKSVRKGIRRKSSWDLRERQFGIEIELEPEQFGYGDIYDPDVDRDAAYSDWINNYEDDEKPQLPSDWLSDHLERIEKRYKHNKDPMDKFELEIWKEIEGWWNNNFVKYEDDRLPEKYTFKPAQSSRDTNITPWDEWWIQQIARHMKKSKKYEKAWNTEIALKKRRIQKIQKILDNPQKTFPFFEEMLKDSINALQKGRKDIKSVFTTKYNKLIELIKDEDDPVGIWSDLEEFSDLIDETVKWLRHGKQEAFEEWLDDNIDYYIDDSKVDLADAVYDAESQMSGSLNISWDFREDGTPAVELVSPPLTSKDMADLYADLKYINRNYDGGSNYSAHIHIEKGSNFGEYEKLASVMLTDEDELLDDFYLGDGRESNLSQWANSMHRRLEDDDSYGESTDAFKLLQKYNSGYNGIMLSKGTTGGKTLEFRYTSSALLSDYPRIMANIQYFMAVVSVAKRKTVIRKELRRTPLGRKVAYLVRDPSSATGCRYQVIDDVSPGKVEEYLSKGGKREFMTLDEPMKRAISKYGNMSAKMVRDMQDIEQNEARLRELMTRPKLKSSMLSDEGRREVEKTQADVRRNVKKMLKKQRRAR